MQVVFSGLVSFLLVLAVLLSGSCHGAAGGQRRTLSRTRTQSLLVSGNPACNFQCKRSGKRKYFCGSDGRTFVTECKARKARCLDPMLTTTPGKCKEATCFQARNYSLHKERESGMSTVNIPSCTADGRYAARQCHTVVGFCWCVTAVGKMIPGSAVKDEEPSCPSSPGNIRRSTESCSASRRSTLVAFILNDSVREYRKSTRNDLISFTTDDVLRQALTKKFLEVGGNSNRHVNSKELRKFLSKQHARGCVESFFTLCDINNDQEITLNEWIGCLFTPSRTPSRLQPPATTTPTTDIFTGRLDTVMKNTKGSCPHKDSASVIEKVKMVIVKDHAQTISAPVSEQELENNALSWKFSQLDANENGMVNYRELKKIRRGFKRSKFKECFVNVCDANHDKDLTQNEWITCFQSNRRRSCIDERREALELQRAKEDTYVPDCDGEDMRYYSQVQCHTNTGYCWCTSRLTGRPIPGTSVINERPHCTEIASETPTIIEIPGCKKPQIFITSVQNAIVKEMVQERSGSNTESVGSQPAFSEGAASWLFTKIDKNLDGLLSNRESKRIKKLLRKKTSSKRCLRKFARYCDDNSNKKITPDEFSKCLQVPDNEDSTTSATLTTPLSEENE